MFYSPTYKQKSESFAGNNYDGYLFYLYITFFFLMSLVPFNVEGLWIHQLKIHLWFIPLYVIFLIILSIRRMNRQWSNFDTWLLILSAAILLSLSASINLKQSIKVYVGFMFKGPLAAFLSYRILRHTPHKSTQYIAICALLVSLFGLAEYLFRWNPYGKSLYTGRNINFATLGNPIAIGSYLTLIFPSALALLFSVTEDTDRTSRYLSPVMMSFVNVIILLSTLLTLSRSSWIALIVACLLFTIIFSLKTKTSHITFLKISGILFILLIVTTVILIKFSSQVNATKTFFTNKFNLQMFHSASFEHRRKSYAATFHILRKYPLTGVGIGNYQIIYKEYLVQGMHPDTPTPDNMYLRLLCDTGIIGTLGFIIFILYWLYRMLKHYLTYDGIFMLAYLCGIVGFLINQTVADLMLWQGPQFAFWTILGLAAGIIQEEEKISFS